MRNRNLLLALSVALMCAASGCIFSPDDDGGGGGTTVVRPFPGTPDQVMENFRTAYSTRDLDFYNEVLHADYRFYFTQEDVLSGAVPTEFWGKAEEMEATENIFSGNAYQSPDGGSEAGVSAITFSQLDQTVDWQPVGPEDPDFPSTQWASFTVAIDFERTGDTTIQVRGQQLFWVSCDTVVVDGLRKAYYQVRGQRDYTSVK